MDGTVEVLQVRRRANSAMISGSRVFVKQEKRYCQALAVLTRLRVGSLVGL